MEQHDWLPLGILGLSILGLKPYSLHSFITVYKLAKSETILYQCHPSFSQPEAQSMGWGGEGKAVSLLLLVSQWAVTHTVFFSLVFELSIQISLVYKKCYSCHSSLPMSQNTINHPEQSAGSCNKKVSKTSERRA